MKSITKKYVEKKAERHDEKSLPPTVILENTATQNTFEIKGFYLEEQIPIGQHTLLFLTDNCPYEETLRITLLSEQDKVLDALEIGGNYTTGVFENLQQTGENTFSFTFFAERIDYLTVHALPQLKFFSLRFSQPFFRKVYLEAK